MPVQVILLENLHVILEKTPRDDIRKEVLPLLYTAFDFSDIEVQVRFSLNYVCKNITTQKITVLNEKNGILNACILLEQQFYT